MNIHLVMILMHSNRAHVITQLVAPEICRNNNQLIDIDKAIFTYWNIKFQLNIWTNCIQGSVLWTWNTEATCRSTSCKSTQMYSHAQCTHLLCFACFCLSIFIHCNRYQFHCILSQNSTYQLLDKTAVLCSWAGGAFLWAEKQNAQIHTKPDDEKVDRLQRTTKQ